jgi:hypothetical protein
MNGFGNSDVGSLIVGFALLAILLGLYFLPSIVASNRNHSNARSIFVLNLFLGWTFLGWIIALIWANSDNTLEREPISQASGSFNSRTWAFIALFAAIAIVAIVLVLKSARKGVNTQEVARLSAPAVPTPQDEVMNSRIYPDREEFRRSGSNSGFQTYTNNRYGFRVDYPESFVAQQSPENGDGLTLKSEDGKATLVAWGMNNAGFTLQDQFDNAIKGVHGELGYNKIGRNWFVVSWTDGDNLCYTKEFVGGASETAFTFTFPVEQRPQYDSIVTTIEKSFKPGDIETSH